MYPRRSSTSRLDELLKPCSASSSIPDLVHKLLTQAPCVCTKVAYKRIDSGEANQKDAVFAAVGCCASMINGNFDINAFFREVLLPELEIFGSSQSLVRRRIAILLSQWITFLGTQERKATYEVFRNLLEPSLNINNQSVRMAAGKRLDKITGDVLFDATAFLLHAEAIVISVVKLIHDTSAPETQVQLVIVLGEIVTMMKPRQVRQFSDQVTLVLATLWQAFEDEIWMRETIIRVLIRLVESLQQYSKSVHPHVLPIIEDALETGTVSVRGLSSSKRELRVASGIEHPRPG